MGYCAGVGRIFLYSEYVVTEVTGLLTILAGGPFTWMGTSCAMSEGSHKVSEPVVLLVAALLQYRLTVPVVDTVHLPVYR